MPLQPARRVHRHEQLRLPRCASQERVLPRRKQHQVLPVVPEGPASAPPPTPAPNAPPSPPGKDACLYNQPGVCIDTSSFVCRGAQVKSGFCRGASNIKCCPSSQKTAKATSPTPPPPKVTPSPPGKDACLYNQAGVCIDTSSFVCKGAQPRTAYCTGAANIRCCPSGQKGAKQATASPATTAPPAPPALLPYACLRGQPGVCIDIRSEACVGGGVKTGFCAGGVDTKCCPTGDVASRQPPTPAPTTPRAPLVGPPPPHGIGPTRPPLPSTAAQGKFPAAAPCAFAAAAPCTPRTAPFHRRWEDTPVDGSCLVI